MVLLPCSFKVAGNSHSQKADELRDQWDARPCPFTKYEYPKLLDESRDALAEFLNVPVSTVVFVPNATTGVNTVLRNISWNPDGKDEILQLSIIYNACAKTTNYICEVTNDLVRTRNINLTFPIEDADLLSAFKAAIQASRGSGHRPRLAIFDTVVDWAQRTLIEEYNTFIPVFFFQGSWWVRLSGQVYMDLDDFDWPGRVLGELCGRAREL